jgi:hypothetical protein
MKIRFVLPLLAAACGSAGSPSGFNNDNGGSSGASGADGGATPYLGDSGAPSFGDATAGDAAAGCAGVDLLFLIDNSASMMPKQQKLAQTWPQFVDAIFSRLPKGIEIHVGMTSTSFYVGSTSEGTMNCQSANSQADVAAHFIKPGDHDDGENGGQGRLYNYQGKAFFTANTSEDPSALKDWFSKAAVAIGQTSSSYEFPAAGVAYATDPANATANAGFFRDQGAVLVLFFLTDEPDKSYDVDTPAHYHDMIAGVKKACGGDQCVLTAGVIDQCIPSTNQFLWQLMTSFGNPQPLAADIEGSQTTYASALGDTLAQSVRDTCAKIAPPR